MAGYALAPGAPPGAVSQSGGSARTPLPKAAPSKAPAKAPVKTVAPPALQQQAATLANQTIAAQVAAIQQQQAAAENQARQQAQQILYASQAAAHSLAGLGTPTYDAYKDAATTLAGLAQGYSGQLQQDASSEAAKVQQGLASIGSQQTATDNGQALANVLYGMRGAQPASVLLNSGAGAAAAANAAPEQILGYGQQVGQGVIGAGLQAANALTPNILQARAQAPSLISQYISSLTDAAAKQQAAHTSQLLANSLINSRTNSTIIANNKLKLSQDEFIKNYNLKVSNANAAAGRATDKEQLPNATLSKIKGYIVNSAGQAIPRDDGKRQVLPGWKMTANGTMIPPPKGSAAKTGPAADYPDLSKTQVLHLRASASRARNGIPVGDKDANGAVVTKAVPPITYQENIAHAIAAGYSRADATKMANRFYAPGVLGRPSSAKQKADQKKAKTALAPPAWTQ